MTWLVKPDELILQLMDGGDTSASRSLYLSSLLPTYELVVNVRVVVDILFSQSLLLVGCK